MKCRPKWNVVARLINDSYRIGVAQTGIDCSVAGKINNSYPLGERCRTFHWGEKEYLLRVDQVDACSESFMTRRLEGECQGHCHNWKILFHFHLFYPTRHSVEPRHNKCTIKLPNILYTDRSCNYIKQ